MLNQIFMHLAVEQHLWLLQIRIVKLLIILLITHIKMDKKFVIYFILLMIALLLQMIPFKFI